MDLVAKNDRWGMYNDRGYIDYGDPYPLRYDAAYRDGGGYFDPGQQRYAGQRAYTEGYGDAFPQHFSPHGYDQDYLGHNVDGGADPFIMHDPIGDIGMRGRYGDSAQFNPYDAAAQDGRFSPLPNDYEGNYGDMRGQIYQDLRYAYDTDDPYMEHDYFPNAQKDPYGQFDGLSNNGFGYGSDYPAYGDDRYRQGGYAMRSQEASGQGMYDQIAYGQEMYDQGMRDPFAADRYGGENDLSHHVDQGPMASPGRYGDPYSQQYPDQYASHGQAGQYAGHAQYQSQYQEGASPYGEHMPNGYMQNQFDQNSGYESGFGNSGQVPNGLGVPNMAAPPSEPFAGGSDAVGSHGAPGVPGAFNQYQQDSGQSPYQDMSASLGPEADFMHSQGQAYSMSSTGASEGQANQVSMSDFGQQNGQYATQGLPYNMQGMSPEMQGAQGQMQNMQPPMSQYQQGVSAIQPDGMYGQQAMTQNQQPAQQAASNFQNDPNAGFGMQGAQGMQGVQGMQGAQFDPMMQGSQAVPMMQGAQPPNGQQFNGDMMNGQMPNGQPLDGQAFDGQPPYMQQPGMQQPGNGNPQFNGQPPVDGLQHPGAVGGATKYLILGILSIILGLIPPIGIVLAILTRIMVKKFRSNGGTDSKADAANIFALVGLIFSIIVLILIVVFIILLLTGSAFALNIAYAFNQSPIGSLITIPI